MFLFPSVFFIALSDLTINFGIVAAEQPTQFSLLLIVTGYESIILIVKKPGSKR
jgi:hypothetical protein